MAAEYLPSANQVGDYGSMSILLLAGVDLFRGKYSACS